MNVSLTPFSVHHWWGQTLEQGSTVAWTSTASWFPVTAPATYTSLWQPQLSHSGRFCSKRLGVTNKHPQEMPRQCVYKPTASQQHGSSAETNQSIKKLFRWPK